MYKNIFNLLKFKLYYYLNKYLVKIKHYFNDIDIIKHLFKFLLLYYKDVINYSNERYV